MAPLRSVRTNQFKLIEDLWTGKIQLFDLSNDPGEMHNLYGHQSVVHSDLLHQLHVWIEKNHGSVADRMPQWRRYAQDPWAKELVTDDQTIGGHMLITGGGWHSDDSPAGASYGGGCLWADGGHGNRTATWRVDNPLIGEYKIYVYYGHLSVGALATDARFTIGTGGDAGSATVDFSHGAGNWNLLGTFKNPRFVQLTNAANGVVIADAVKFERVGE
jgi:hypothetical protein